MKVVLTTGLLCGVCQRPLHPHIRPGEKTTVECTNPACSECGVIAMAPEVDVVIEPEVIDEPR